VSHQKALRETLPTLDPVQTAVTRAYKRRFPDIQGTETGDQIVDRLEKTVHKGLEYLIPLLEFAKLQAEYLDIEARREAARADGKGASSVMPVTYLQRLTIPSTIADDLP
jgi:hypothetical protein